MNVSEEQLAAIGQGEAVSITVGKTDCMVIRKDVYQKIQQVVYDDSDWSDKEMEALALRAH